MLFSSLKKKPCIHSQSFAQKNSLDHFFFFFETLKSRIIVIDEITYN